MKKVFSLLLPFILVLSLCACGKKDKGSTAEDAVMQPVIEQTEEEIHSSQSEAASETPEEAEPQNKSESEEVSDTTETASIEAEAPQAPDAPSESDPVPTAAPKTWEIDKNLVVYECILDWYQPNMYHISFAECDAAGNVVNVFAIEDIINPSKLGEEFAENPPFPYWFFPGATVHVRANSDLSDCTVTQVK